MSQLVCTYFAYGSNLNIRLMRRRCPAARPVSRAVLAGFRLAFPRCGDDWHNRGVAGVEPNPTGYVEGALYDVTAQCLVALDEYEGVFEDAPHYYRANVTVTLPDGRPIEAVTYRAYPQVGAPFAPAAPYVHTMIEGARDHELSERHVERLHSLLQQPV